MNFPMLLEDTGCIIIYDYTVSFEVKWRNSLSGWQSTAINTKPSPISYNRTVYLDMPTWTLIDDPTEV